MKLGKKVSLVWWLVTGVYVVVMAMGTLAVQNKYMTWIRKREEGKIEALVDQYLVSKKDTLMKIVVSHSYWTEFRDELIDGNTHWIAENTSEYLLDGYDIDSVYVFSEKSNYEKVWGEFLESDFSRLKDLFKIKKEGSELVIINNNIYLMGWAPIADNNRRDPIGMYLIGEKIELSDLTEFLRIFSFIPVSIEIYKGPESSQGLTIPLADEISLRVGYQLPEFEKKIKLMFLYIMGMVALVTLLLFGIFMKYIRRSTDRISKIIAGIERISKGDYTHPVILGETDEEILLAGSINKLSWSIREKIIKEKEGYNDSLRLLIKTMEVKDYYTRGHSERVAFFSKAMGMAMGYEDIDALEEGALLHDIGKIAIPQSILNKKGKLTDSEYEIIKLHSVEGEKILREVPSFLKIKDLVLYHHERVDGSGYPKGLVGDEIPLGARIIAVADVFDAITSDRPYRKALELEEALTVMKKERGKGLDKNLVNEFLHIAEDIYIKEKMLRNIKSEKREFQEEVKKIFIEKEENIV